MLGVMSLLVLYEEVVFFSAESPGRARLFSMGWLLFPHIFFAAIAFLTGPVQFSTQLRKRNLPLHRLAGRVYAASIFLGAPMAIVLSIRYPMAGGNFMFENIIQATVWMFTTAIAWQAARNRQLVLHQVWMARSYAVTFIFVSSRVLAYLPFFRRMDVATFTGFLWFLLVFSLLIPDLFINGRALWVKQARRPAMQ